MREHKGKSIISFPDDYTIIDIETTGLSPLWDEIIEIGAVRCRSGVLKERYSTLVRCRRPLDPFIVDLTGITDSMLTTAPWLGPSIRGFYDFVGSDILVGHNVSFDINFLYDACERCLEKPLTNDYINTVRFANKLVPRSRKTLSAVCDALDIPVRDAHRAIGDCLLTHAVFEKMKEMVDDRGAFKKLFEKKGGPGGGKKLNVKDILADPDYIPDENTDIYGQSFCFTGKLDQMPRKDACQIVVNMGGSLTGSVTKKTNYLVLGSTDYCNTIKDGKTTKMKKAEELQAAGGDIMIISEDVFYQMIEDY